MSFHKNQEKQLIKSAGLLGVLTAISRVFGLVREIFLAAILGTSIYSDAFTLAFSVPDLFRRLFAEGVLIGAFFPSYNAIKLKEGNKAASEFAGSLFTLIAVVFSCLFLIIFVFLPEFLNKIILSTSGSSLIDATIPLIQIMSFYIVFVSLASIYQGVLNSFSIFWVSSLTPVLLNISVISFALIFSPKLDNPAIGFAVGIIVGGVIQLLFHVPFAIKKKINLIFRFDWKNSRVKSVFVQMIPTSFSIGVYQINIFVGNLIASTLAIGSLSALKFSNRLMEFVIAIFVVSFATVLLPNISTSVAENRSSDLKNAVSFSIDNLSFVLLPIALGGLFLSNEIVTVIYARGSFDSHSVSLTSSAFRIHLLGLVFIGWNRILLAIYQAYGQTKEIIRMGTLIILLNTLLAFILSRYFKHIGIAQATSISQVAHTVLLVFFLRKFSANGKFKLFTSNSMLKSTLGSIIMLLVLSTVTTLQILPESNSLIKLVINVLIGAFVYLVCSYLIKNSAIKTLPNLIRKNASPI